MATNGVKILDSDISNDTYSTIIGLFENGNDIDAVRKQYPFERKDYGPESDFYHELFVTAYAYAVWELGWLQDDILEEVKNVISTGASIAHIAEELGISEGRKRQAVLNEFLLEISTKNPRIRRRKVYKQTAQPFFKAGDVITYQNSLGVYRVLLCVADNVEKGKVWYTFTPISVYSNTVPTMDEIKSAGLYGVRIGTSGDRDSVNKSQEGVSNLWEKFSEASKYLHANSLFVVGLQQEFIQHTNIASFKHQLHRIGKLILKPQFNKQGSGCFNNNFDQFDKSEKYYLDLGYYAFPVNILCEV